MAETQPSRRTTGNSKPRVGIIGKGHVGQALSKGLERSGYETRSVGKEAERVRETARWAELVVLAVPYGERDNALSAIGDAARDKVLIDVTNALGEDGSFIGSSKRSGAEELQEKAAGAAVVKAFNTVFAQHMSNGNVNGEKLTLLIAGDQADAKEKVQALGTDLGFDVVDAGPLAAARNLESLGYLNIQLGYKQGLGPDIGFRLVH